MQSEKIESTQNKPAPARRDHFDQAALRWLQEQPADLTVDQAARSLAKAMREETEVEIAERQQAASPPADASLAKEPG